MSRICPYVLNVMLPSPGTFAETFLKISICFSSKFCNSFGFSMNFPKYSDKLSSLIGDDVTKIKLKLAEDIFVAC